jgi:hypothetical protein
MWTNQRNKNNDSESTRLNLLKILNMLHSNSFYVQRKAKKACNILFKTNPLLHQLLSQTVSVPHEPYTFGIHEGLVGFDISSFFCSSSLFCSSSVFVFSTF